MVGLNDELLRAFGGSDLDSPAFPVGWQRSPELDAVRARAPTCSTRSSTAWRCGASTAHVPDVPFWQDLLAERAIEVRYVVCLRSPADTAAAGRLRRPAGQRSSPPRSSRSRSSTAASRPRWPAAGCTKRSWTPSVRCSARIWSRFRASGRLRPCRILRRRRPHHRSAPARGDRARAGSAAALSEEEKAAERRADKAAYLREKLDERAEAEDERADAPARRVPPWAMSEHEQQADEVERELDDMQQRSERLEDDIDEAREDWERKQHDS